MQGKRQCRCVVWIINWALQIHCNPRVPLGAIKLVSEDWTKRDHRGLQRIYGIWYSFCILGKGFARTFEVKQLCFPESCFSYSKNHFFWISNNEKWLSLKKFFWKVYHHSKCSGRYSRSFVFSTSITIWKDWLYVWKFLHWIFKNT